jgi:hypothetical protein
VVAPGPILTNTVEGSKSHDPEEEEEEDDDDDDEDEAFKL